MPHQNTGMKAGVSPYSVVPETKKEEEYQSLEEALTGEKYPEPKGEPSY